MGHGMKCMVRNKINNNVILHADKGDQNVQTSSDKINKFYGYNIS